LVQTKILEQILQIFNRKKFLTQPQQSTFKGYKKTNTKILVVFQGWLENYNYVWITHLLVVKYIKEM
jgi:hypothetical protein